jgi:hypothetical protein
MIKLEIPDGFVSAHAVRKPRCTPVAYGAAPQKAAVAGRDYTFTAITPELNDLKYIQLGLV